MQMYDKISEQIPCQEQVYIKVPYTKIRIGERTYEKISRNRQMCEG